MSHYSVLVTLPGSVRRKDLDDALAEVLAPYDENIEVEPYRKYEEGAPEQHWLVSAVRRSARDLAAGSGILPYKPNELGISSASSKKTPDEQREDLARDAAVAEKLGEHPTWPQVIAAYAERYPGEANDLLYDEETDRAYYLSTYNPDSKWDYWRIGGRWGAHYPIARDGVDILLPKQGWDSPKDMPEGYCNGGRKRDLDLARLRTEAATTAEGDWNEYWLTVHGTPEALPWSTFAERVDQSGNGGYAWADARREYGAQERIAAIRASEKFRYWDAAHDTFESLSREDYAARQAARAVPGYALLDGIGDLGWMAPGRMGWFAMSTDDEHSYAEYTRRANDLIDNLPDDAWLVVVDCHI